jgi:general stress protein 26
MDASERVRVLLGRRCTVYLATLREDGLPHVRAISVMKSEGLRTVWMITNSSDDKVRELEHDPRCMIYATTVGDDPDFAELRLWGKIEISDDTNAINDIWDDIYDSFFQDGGRNDPSVRVLKFEASSGVVTTQFGREIIDFEYI